MRSRNRTLSFALLLTVFVALPVVAGPPDQANNRKTVTVMTRNVYLGASLTPAIEAILDDDFLEILGAVSGVWGGVQFTDFPARAESLAGEIEKAQPDLIGLQEAEVWRSQTPSDIIEGNRAPNAVHVEYDYVQLLLDALSRKGLHYAVVARETGVDVEAPCFLSEADAGLGKISDIRLTEHEVILARTDLKTSELKLSNPQSGHFQYIIEAGSLRVLRGWVSVDAKVRGKSFRFVSTHLEADSPLIRDLQAMEVLDGPANTSLPVVLAADANSNANGTTETPETGPEAYDIFIGAGFTDAWFEAHPGRIVSTCCNAPDLTNTVFLDPNDNEGRIDLLLYRGPHDFSTLGADLFGTDPSDKVSNGLGLIWPSDHAGVAVRLQIPK